MKYTKRAISLLLIATMLLAMIPFSMVSAADIAVAMVTDETGNTVATGGAITITPGMTLWINGTQVTSGTTIEVYWDTVVSSAQINTTTGNPDATFGCFVDVPDTAAGNHYIWVRDAGTSQTASSLVLVISETVEVDPTSGLAGDPVDMTGSGFDASEGVEIWFNNTRVVAYSDDVETNSVGTFATEFDVPSGYSYGVHQVMANVSGVTANATFTIGAAFTLSVEEGPAGTIVTITGRGYTDDRVIENNAGNITLGTYAMYTKDASSFTISGTGTFTIQVVVPSAPVGEYTLTVTDGDETATDTFDVTGTSSISLSQGYGTPGTVITVTGVNFTQISGTDVDISILGSSYATADVDATGSFSVAITLPALGLGANYAIWANDTRNCNATKNVLIALIMLQLNVNSGPVGSNVTLSGTGFNNSGGGDYNASLGDISIIAPGTALGGVDYFSTVFQVPTMPSGTYTLTVLDAVADIEVTTSFTVTDQATLTPSVTEAPNQYNLSISGDNFANIDGTATTWYLFNDTYETEIIPEYGGNPVTCDDDGEFTGYWVIPWGLELGTYSINCSTATSADIEQYAECSIDLVEETYTYAPSRATYARGEAITWNIRAMFAKNLELGVKDADGNDMYNTSWVPGDWTQSGTIWYIAVSDQGLLSVPDDATPGQWVYEFSNTTSGELYVSGEITIKEKTDVQELQEAVAGLSTGLTTVSDAVTALAGTVDLVSGAVSSASAAAANAAAAAADAKTAADSAAAAVGDVGDTANDALDAANDAKTSADAAKAAADSGLAAANDAKATAQSAADAANDAKDAAEGAQQAASGLTTLVYGAIGASLIAALAAIVSLMQISRRIAG